MSHSMNEWNHPALCIVEHEGVGLRRSDPARDQASAHSFDQPFDDRLQWVRIAVGGGVFSPYNNRWPIESLRRENCFRTQNHRSFCWRVCVTFRWTEDGTVRIATTISRACGPVGIRCHTHFTCNPSRWIRCQSVSVEGNGLWLKFS